MIFHLTSQQEWQQASVTGKYVPASLQTEGFIHLSSFGQILNVANSFYKSVEGAVLLALDDAQLGEELKWEGVDGLEFPHLYRPIQVAEVVSVIYLEKNQDGSYISSPQLELTARAISLETDRLFLREFQVQDAEAIHSYASDEDLVKYMPWGPNNLKQTREFLTRNFKYQVQFPRKNYDFAIVEKSSGQFIGSGGLILSEPNSEFAHVGYILRRESHGKGFATELTQALIKFGFEKLNLVRIAATCDSENTASFRVMERAGMCREGLLRENMKLKGRVRSTFVYSILKSEYLRKI